MALMADGPQDCMNWKYKEKLDWNQEWNYVPAKSDKNKYKKKQFDIISKAKKQRKKTNYNAEKIKKCSSSSCKPIKNTSYFTNKCDNCAFQYLRTYRKYQYEYCIWPCELKKIKHRNKKISKPEQCSCCDKTIECPKCIKKSKCKCGNYICKDCSCKDCLKKILNKYLINDLVSIVLYY